MVEETVFRELELEEALKLEKTWLRANEIYLFPLYESVVQTMKKSKPHPVEFTKTLDEVSPIATEPEIMGEGLQLSMEQAKKADEKTMKRVRSKENDKQQISEKRIKVEAIEKVDKTSNSKRQGVHHYRVKWSEKDVAKLWTAIMAYGNKWSYIKQRLFPKRTNDQVKDKGKRLLRTVGWKTGSSKSDSSSACESAKHMAADFLAKSHLAQYKVQV